MTSCIIVLFSELAKCAIFLKEKASYSQINNKKQVFTGSVLLS